MATITAFDNPWYAEMIERFSPDPHDKNSSVARAILAGFSILATAVDGLTAAVDKVNDENNSGVLIAQSVDGLTGEGSQIASALKAIADEIRHRP